jgi:hypothetical protein
MEAGSITQLGALPSLGRIAELGSFLPSDYRRSSLIVKIVSVSVPPKTYPPVRTAAAGAWPLRQPRNPPAVPTSKANIRPRANHIASRSSFAGGLGDLANVLSSISFSARRIGRLPVRRCKTVQYPTRRRPHRSAERSY